MNKICPLLLMGNNYKRTINGELMQDITENIYVRCLKNECEWFHEKLKKCYISIKGEDYLEINNSDMGTEDELDPNPCVVNFDDNSHEKGEI
jgi:hypothetical protein